MAKFDAKTTMLLERKTWGWSPLYHAFRKVEEGLPTHIKHPLLHSNDEFSDLLIWIADDILPRLQLALVPLAVMAMKLLVRL
jgi:hypothetical protein